MNKRAKNSEEPEGFPRELLKQPKSKWIEYFRGYGVDHPTLKDARKKLIRFSLGAGNKMLAFIIGPTGAGKTFLRECIEDYLRSMAAEDDHWNPTRIPCVSIDVPGKDTLKPSWSDVYVRLLRALYEPESFIRKKIIHGDLALKFDTQGHLSFGSGATIRKYRYALEQSLKHRKPFIVGYEEAQHLLDFAGLSCQELMDCVKSIASMTNIRHALYGNYEMQVLLDQSDQLMRRSVIIHVRRYSTTDVDQQNFRSTIYSFQLNMPLPQTPDLLKHGDYLYERTAGCVGILSDWLAAAYSQALDEPKVTTVKLSHLEENVPFSASRAHKMLMRIARDEQEFLKEFSDDASDMANVSKVQDKGLNDISDEAPQSKPKRRGRKVGERAPVRDENLMVKRNAA